MENNKVKLIVTNGNDEFAFLSVFVLVWVFWFGLDSGLGSFLKTFPGILKPIILEMCTAFGSWKTLKNQRKTNIFWNLHRLWKRRNSRKSLLSFGSPWNSNEHQWMFLIFSGWSPRVWVGWPPKLRRIDLSITPKFLRYPLNSIEL